MVGGIIVAVIVLLVIAGLWWTRDGGGPAGGVDGPTHEDVLREEVSDLMPAEHEDREHEIE
ncbi:MAG TPA: hypothetical protein VKG82_09390 [Solirubrobacteraceae bacterium]|nr:hypothetical protein [Solirubrobacteraceae bacterium]